MSLQSPQKYWWDEPLDKDEKMWLTVAIIWALFLTLFMPYMHYTGKQNPSQEYAKISGDKFDAAVDKFIAQYKVGEEAGFAVVAPPPNSDIFIRGKQFTWDPILKLKKGVQYKLHLSSLDMNHGLSVQPVNFTIQVVPGWDNILNITPTTTGVFTIICNEYCGLGHHTMVGRMYVD